MYITEEIINQCQQLIKDKYDYEVFDNEIVINSKYDKWKIAIKLDELRLYHFNLVKEGFHLQKIYEVSEVSLNKIIKYIKKHDLTTSWKFNSKNQVFGQKKDLIYKLRKMYLKFDRMPFPSEMYNPYCGNYYKTFGTWEIALNSAGIEIEDIDDIEFNRSELLNILWIAIDKLGDIPSQDYIRDIPIYIFENVFGNWENALKEAGIYIGHIDIKEKVKINKQTFLKKDMLKMLLDLSIEAGIPIKILTVSYINKNIPSLYKFLQITKMTLEELNKYIYDAYLEYLNTEYSDLNQEDMILNLANELIRLKTKNEKVYNDKKRTSLPYSLYYKLVLKKNWKELIEYLLNGNKEMKEIFEMKIKY